MIKASLMGIAEVDVPEAVGASFDVTVPALGGKLTLTRTHLRRLRMEFDNVDDATRPASAPFKANFQLDAVIETANGRVVYRQLPAQPTTGVPFSLPRPGGRWWELRYLELAIFEGKEWNFFRPVFAARHLREELERVFNRSRVMTRRFSWAPSEDGGSSELFRLTFPHLRDSTKSTIWEWQRWNRGQPDGDPDEALANPAFGDTESESQLFDFMTDGGDPGRYSQDLQIRRYACNPLAPPGQRAMAVCLKPRRRDRTLDVDPAIRDRTLRADHDNVITHGLTLANGELVITGDADHFYSSTDPFELHWETAPDGKSAPLILLNSVTDEHSLPVALHADADFRLDERPDFASEQSDYQDHMTIGGLDLFAAPDTDIHASADDPTRTKRAPIKGEAMALEVATSVADDDSSIRTEWAFVGEIVTVRSGLPKEVEASMHNAFLRPTSTAAAAARLDLEDVEYAPAASAKPAKGPLTLKRLHFDGDASSWRLTQIYEEETYATGGLPRLNAGAVPVGRRESAKPATDFGVPAMDVRYAAANMPKADTGNPRRSVATELAATRWFRAIDNQLIDRFATIERGKMQKHLSGFQLDAQMTVSAYATVIGRMRTEVGSLVHARNEPVQSESAEDNFHFGAPRPATPVPLNVSSPVASPLYALRLVKYRLWLLQYIVDGIDREGSEFADGEFVKWEAARNAATQLLSHGAEFNLNRIRTELLRKIEGLSAPTRQLRQLAVVLATIFERHGVQFLVALEDAAANLTVIPDPEKLAEHLKTLADDHPLTSLVQLIQGVVRGWGPLFDPAAYPVATIGEVLPVYHRHTMAVLRIVHKKQHRIAEVQAALQALPAALKDTQTDGRDLFTVIERAWLYKIRRSAQGRELIAKLGGEAAMTTLQDALLGAIEPTQEFVIRLMARLRALQKAATTSNADLDTLVTYFAEAASQLDSLRDANFDAIVQQGRNEVMKQLQQAWDDASAQAIKDIRKYVTDEIFNDEVYQKILVLEQYIHDAQNALKEACRLRDQLVETVLGLGENAGDLLQSLKNEPPAYLVVGRAFHVKLAPQQQALLDRLLAMWGRSFDLCSLGAGQAWDFQLTDATTLILKLSGSMSLTEVLLDIQAKFREDAGEPDPLGLWSPDFAGAYPPPHKVQAEQVDDWSRAVTQQWVSQFVDGELHLPSWRGVFLVNPLADLERNPITRDLCGLRYIGARYIALGGGSMTFADNAGNDRDTLDVYATIFKKATKQMRADVTAADREEDAGIALTKFDARIKNTQLRANSVIELTLDINRLFGRDYSQIANDDDKEGFNKIIISGKTREPDRLGGNDAGMALEFAAVFPEERKIKIDVLFIDTVNLRSIKAAIRNGRTSLDINGDIVLQPWKFDASMPVPDLGFGFDALAGSRLLLQGFRLNFPPLDQVVEAAMGALRELIFDFESLRVSFPKPRALTLGFMELTVRGVGYIRRQHGKGRDEIEKFWRQFTAFGGTGSPNAEFDLPYMLFDVDFGQLPNFGLGSIDRLQLTVVVAAQLGGAGTTSDLKVYFGIRGLDAKDINIDLFRLLKLSIAHVYITNNVPSLLPPYDARGDHYTAMGAENIRLQMLGIDLIGKAKGEGTDGSRGLDFLMLQNASGGRAVLGVVNLRDAGLEPPFIDLNWVLLGRNIQVDDKILDHLLLFDNVGGDEVVRELVSRKKTQNNLPGPVKGVKAGITGRNDWLFGISFGFAGLIENCRLVLQDEVYYGITLQDDFLVPIFGDDHLTLAYIPGNTPSQDRFLLDVPLAFLDLFANVQAGWGTFSWALNTDALIGLGFPFRVGHRYRWDRAFSIYLTPLMGQFGCYIEKRTRTLKKEDGQRVTLGGGIGLTVGYGFALGNSMIWVRGGIGVFAIVEGSITSRLQLQGDLKFAVVAMRIRGVIGIIAFVEGGIDIWIVSARFRVELQAALGVEIIFERDTQPLLLAYDTTLYAGYDAQATIRLGFAKITFRVSGEYPIGVSGQHLLE